MNANEPTLPEESLFLQAVEIGSADERAAFLNRACGTDAELRRGVEALLRHHDEESDFLEAPPTEVVEAAAQAMQRILVESARRKQRHRHGGQLRRVELPDEGIAATPRDEELLLLDEALGRLAAIRPQAAALVQLRYFGGQTVEEAAAIVGISERTARRLWIFAQAWLRREIETLDDGKSLADK